jgi:hypothetical protein
MNQEEQQAYWALQHERPDPSADDGPAYRIVTRIPVGGGRSVHFYSLPVASLAELGRTVMEMREHTPRSGGGPWWPAVEYRPDAASKWESLSAYEWEQRWKALTGKEVRDTSE